ncbi:c-type cytochrome [Rhodobacteraceae bacterium 2CG4]|uniref:C-type cytochrome n=1 Tax=Halovulum marinum TaxID=2662447 RepID=A0A6L5YW48_9RHOB|nr:cytochrome c family protein [Halovulum marinum]MSU88576.1 c-type cytochrome [Halovulum marinum]
MDTMEITKIVGGVCGSLLVFLLIQTGAESLIVAEPGHGDEEQFAYGIEAEEAGGEEAAPEAEVPFGEVFASADAAAGEGLFRACASCHKLEDGANAVGPYLYGVVGRDIAAVDGYSYSDALAGLDGAWTPEDLSAFLAAPSDYAPGTKMSYRGMRDVEDRANLIAYLQSIGG